MRGSRSRSLLALALLLLFYALPSAARADAVADVVITEIMYNPASDDRREDFIELHNQGTVSYNLQGWQFEDAVVFTFPGVTLGPGQYLVVCADQARIRQLHGINNTVGNWNPASTLDNGGERIRLLDQNGVEIEDITYDDRNPWPILADGFGHSLEKRNPSGDNDDPANWAASATGQGWTRVSVTGLATSSKLYIYLGAAGTAYVDDVEIHPVGNPGDNRVQNAGFESGNLSPWAANGTHSTSGVTVERARSGSRSLKIVATAAGTGQAAAVYQDGLGLVLTPTPGQYTLSFWAYTTAPGQRIIARLSQSDTQPNEPIYVENGGGGATPGRVNSVSTSDIPPFVYPAFQVPETPVATETVTILAAVRDDVAVSAVTAHWDGGAGERTMTMLDDGAHGDGAAADGLYGAAIGKFATGAIVRYWVTAEDSRGQSGRFPFAGNPTPSLGFYIEPAGINPAFQARSNSGLASTKPAVYHFLLSTDAQNQLAASPATYVRGTFIYNGEVFENVRIRYRGQSSLGTPKKHWKVDFNKDHRFLTPFEDHPEVDNINVQSSYGDKSFLREWLSYKAWMDVGQPALEMWHVRLYLNGAYRGLYVHLENADEDWLDRAGLDPEGWLWKAYSQARSGTGGFEPEEMAANPIAANDALAEFINSMNTLTGGALDDYIRDNMNVQSFTDFLALHQLIHNCDHPAKNYFVYADEDAPEGTWTYYLWDADLTHGRNYECGGGGVYNDTMRYDMFGDPQLLFGTSLRPKCDGPWNGVINGFLNRTTAFREAFYVRVEELLERNYKPSVLNPLIDDMAAPLLAEIEMDWNRNPPGYGTRVTAQHHVNQLKGYIQNRHNYLSNALAKLTAPDVSDLTCARSGDSATLGWKNNDTRYSAIRIYRNGALVQTLAASAVGATVLLDLAQSLNTLRVASVFSGVERPGESCTIVTSSGDYATVINQDFDPPASSAELQVNCAAQQANGVLQLTPPAGDQAGTAFFRTRFPSNDFIAEFDLRFDEPSSPGADGIVFAMVRGNDPTLCGSPGGALGFWQSDAGGVVLDGYGVVFDTWQNPGEPSHNWMGFIDTARQASGAFSAVNVPEEFTGNGVFHVRVAGKAGAFTVDMGNGGIGMAMRRILTYVAPGFVPEDLHFGFSAGTGGATTRHSADNFVLQVKSGAPAPVVAAFHAELTDGDAPLTVDFVNDSTGAASYEWSFGDEAGSTQASPRHTYQAPGVYTVALTASGPGGRDVETKTNYITARVKVTADFAADKTVGAVPLAVRFTNRSQSNAPIVSYAWDFGDGSTSNVTNPSRIYRSGGQFTVSLKVTGQGGMSDTITRTNFIRVDDLIQADFSGAPLTGPAPLEVQFTDGSIGSTIQSWSWTFGDGGTAGASDPKHVYAAPGTFGVRLQVAGFQSVDSEEKLGYIVVTPRLEGYVRGDANADGRVDISDAVAILGYLFLAGPSHRCRDVLDANDDAQVDISDAVAVLAFLFQGEAAPAEPFPEPGLDATPDGLPECGAGGGA